MRGKMRTHRTIFVVCLVVSGLLAPLVDLAEDCRAEAEASLEHESRDGDVVRLQFKVQVRTEADCGKILYDLVIEEMLPNQQTKKIRKPNSITLQDGSVDAVMRHEMPSSHEMLSYEATVVSCEPCSAP